MHAVHHKRGEANNANNTCPVSSGVPQGSVIGFLLFNLYVNDVIDTHDPSTVTTKMFADDLKMYSELGNTNSDFNLQLHLDLINTWSTLWQLIRSPKL